MGLVIEHHKKFLNRWADIFIQLLKTKGPQVANEWASRMFDEDTQKKLVPIISEKRARKR